MLRVPRWPLRYLICILVAVVVLVCPLPGLALARSPCAATYDSLVVSSVSPGTILLGTSTGLFQSTNAGRSWQSAGFAGKTIADLVQAGSRIYLAGNGLLASSSDGGRRWVELRPTGLPDLDIHDLAIDPNNARVLFAVLNAGGLYRSTDRGDSFRLISRSVGPAIDALAGTPAGLVAGDISNGIYLSPNGRNWEHAANGMVMGIAVSPTDPNRILAATWGIADSSNGGRHWTMTLKLKVMFGSAAWAPGKPHLAYAVGYYNGSLWRSTSSGENWKRIATQPAPTSQQCDATRARAAASA